MARDSHTTCPACGHAFVSAAEVVTEISLPCPVYPMYDLKPAAEFIPTTYRALIAYLGRNKTKYPARYRIYEDAKGIRRRVRILSSREILQIRSDTLRGIGKDTQ